MISGTAGFASSKPRTKQEPPQHPCEVGKYYFADGKHTQRDSTTRRNLRRVSSRDGWELSPQAAPQPMSINRKPHFSQSP